MDFEEYENKTRKEIVAKAIPKLHAWEKMANHIRVHSSKRVMEHLTHPHVGYKQYVDLPEPEQIRKTMELMGSTLETLVQHTNQQIDTIETLRKRIMELEGET